MLTYLQVARHRVDNNCQFNRPRSPLVYNPLCLLRHVLLLHLFLLPQMLRLLRWLL
jgi:hypothetical protein